MQMGATKKPFSKKANKKKKPKKKSKKKKLQKMSPDIMSFFKSDSKKG